MVRAVVLQGPKDVRVEARQPERRGPGKALVRLRCAGICGSDLAAYRGTSPLVQYPRVLGHELVVDVLESPDQPALEGRRAVIEPLLPCGTCRTCRLGRYNCCPHLQVLGVHVDGGLREIAVVDAGRLYPVPDDMADALAVLAEPTTIAYRAVQRANIGAGQVAVVLGAGTIGFLIANLLLRARGCRVLIADVDPWRLQKAAALGAVPLPVNVSGWTRAVAAATAGEMADVVFEASGNAACTRMTTELAGFASRIVLIGWNKGPVEVDTVTLMRKEIDLVGSRNSTGAFLPVLRLLADGVIDDEALITHRFALAETPMALQLLDTGSAPALKVLIEDPS